MKFVKINENSIDLIKESERFIDIYTFENCKELCKRWPYGILEDENKEDNKLGWKLI